MKCRKCSRKAVINMRQHKLALCKGHYLDWLPEQVQRVIKKYQMFTHEERLLVAVSGGKDSLALWDILTRLGYKAEGLYIGLGIDGDLGYSDESRRLSFKFAEERGLKLNVVDVPVEYGESIPEIAKRTERGRDKPCSVCGLAKRHLFNKVASEGGFDVLATGHNLDDEAAILFGNTLKWLPGYLRRQGPALEARAGLVRKVKPLCRIYEREMAAYAFLRDIEYIYEECPYAKGAKTIYYKELLNELESREPSAKLQFYLSFLTAKETGLFTEGDAEKFPLDNNCTTCGQPTTVPGECAFCRMVEKGTTKG